jgi:hypothetical protein
MRSLFVIAAVTATVTATLLGLFATAPAPVSAHDKCVYHGKYRDKTTSDYACVSSDHRTLRVCDVERDGHYVEAWVWWPSGPLGFIDKNGSKFPCSQYELPRGAYRLAVCEAHKGCSRYEDA